MAVLQKNFLDQANMKFLVFPLLEFRQMRVFVLCTKLMGLEFVIFQVIIKN